MPTSLTIQEIEKLKEKGIIYHQELSTGDYHCLKVVSGLDDTGVSLFIKKDLALDKIDLSIIDNNSGAIGYRDGNKKLNLYVDNSPANIRVDLDYPIVKENHNEVSFHISEEFALINNGSDIALHSNEDTFYFNKFVADGNRDVKLFMEDKDVDNFYLIDNTNIGLKIARSASTLVYDGIFSEDEQDGSKRELVLSNEDLSPNRGSKANIIEIKNIRLTTSSLAPGRYEYAISGSEVRANGAIISIESPITDANNIPSGLVNSKEGGKMELGNEITLLASQPTIVNCDSFVANEPKITIEATNPNDGIRESIIMGGKEIEVKEGSYIKLSSATLILDNYSLHASISGKNNIEMSALNISGENNIEIKDIDLYHCEYVKHNSNVMKFTPFLLQNIKASNAKMSNISWNPEGSLSIGEGLKINSENELFLIHNCDFNAIENEIILRSAPSDIEKRSITLERVVSEGEKAIINAVADCELSIKCSNINNGSLAIGRENDVGNGCHNLENVSINGETAIETNRSSIKETTFGDKTKISGFKIDMDNCFTENVNIINYEKASNLGLTNRTFKSAGEKEIKPLPDFMLNQQNFENE